MRTLLAAKRVQCAVEGHAWLPPVLRSRYTGTWRQTCGRCGYMSYPTKREREMRGFPAEGEDEHHD